eukprot:8767-Heterococcus_DN1.PRE.1
MPNAQCPISLAALPPFAAADVAAEECSSLCLPKWVLKYEHDEVPQQLEEQTLEMTRFVDR